MASTSISVSAASASGCARAPRAAAQAAVRFGTSSSMTLASASSSRARIKAPSSVHGISASAQRPAVRAKARGVVCSAAAEAKKVAVLGAAGGIGQPLSMLMSMNHKVSQLALYDIANVAGVAADLSHCNNPCETQAYTGAENLAGALKGCELVIIPAGVPRKPGMTRDDLFSINAGIVKTLVEGVAEHCPKAFIAIISNPVNSTVPIAAETLKKAGVYDKNKLFGVTTLDVVRSNKFVADATGSEVGKVNVPVIGGHAGITILPLLSQVKVDEKSLDYTDATREALTVRIQNAGTEVVEAKAGAGSATLSMAYAAALFADSCLEALCGYDKKVTECAYVESTACPGLDYFASPVIIGKNGIEEILGTGELTEYEQGWLDKLKEELKGSIAKGVAFAQK